MAETRKIMNFEKQFSARTLAEEEAQRVIEAARIAAEARAIARAKAREQNETWIEAAKAEAIAAEEARIAAASKDEWHYIRNGERFGPVGLVEMRAKVTDTSLDPPVHLVWTEGMDEWRPVFDVRKVCDPNHEETAAEAKAAEQLLLQAAQEKAASDIRAREKEENKLRAAESEAEAKLKALAAKAAEEAKLRASMEAKAAADIKAAREAAKVEANAAEASGRRKSGKSSKGGWFYTCEGDRLGPVTFDELRSMAADSSLDPRRDMVWKEGMDAWMQAGKIDGLFERNNGPEKTEAPKPPLQSALSHIAPPQQTARAIKSSGDAPWPGARRRSLWFALLVFPVVWHFALGMGGPHLVKQFGEVMMSRILPLAVFVPIPLLVHFSLKRLLNLGMSRWWLLALFAPVLNLWIGYRCLVCPSGYAQHKRLDGPGIALAIIYWLIMLTVVAVIGIALAPLFESPDGIKIPAQLRALMDRFSA